jgi:glycosyltransferase involved in cell wall biosynthesis
MADLFRSLGPEYTVHFQFGAAEDRPWRASLRERYRSRVFSRRFGIDWHFVKLMAREKYACFVMCSWNDPTTLISILLARVLGRHYMIWTDTPHRGRRRSSFRILARAAILRFAFGGARAVMGTGAPALAELRRLGCPEAKLVNFPYFVDVKQYGLRTPQKGSLRLISVGRLVADKSFDTALRALAKYRGEFVYRIAGTGTEEARLRALAEELGLAGRVEFLGWLEPEALRTLYERSDVLLHPARFEPYGVCVLEAMASGLVVIGSTGTAAVIDRIIDGVNGFYHRIGDIDGLLEKINHLNCDTIGAAARKTAEEWPMTRAKEILNSAVSRGR